VLNTIKNTHSPAAERHTTFTGKKETYQYSPISESSPHLKFLLELYWQGLSEPLPFFPNTSYAFAQAIHKGKSEQEALHKAAIDWNGDSYTIKGEKNDPYNLLCCRNINLATSRFMETAKTIFLPALEFQEKIRPSDLQAGSN
jgi:exodeoxyribonuclease V gamma subunit